MIILRKEKGFAKIKIPKPKWQVPSKNEIYNLGTSVKRPSYSPTFSDNVDIYQEGRKQAYKQIIKPQTKALKKEIDKIEGIGPVRKVWEKFKVGMQEPVLPRGYYFS